MPAPVVLAAMQRLCAWAIATIEAELRREDAEAIVLVAIAEVCVGEALNRRQGVCSPSQRRSASMAGRSGTSVLS